MLPLRVKPLDIKLILEYILIFIYIYIFNIFNTRTFCTSNNSLHAAEKTEESISLLEKVLGPNDSDAENVKARAKTARDARRASARAGTGSGKEAGDGGGRRGGNYGAGDGGPVVASAGGGGEADWQTPGVDVLSTLCCLRWAGIKFLRTCDKIEHNRTIKYMGH